MISYSKMQLCMVLSSYRFASGWCTFTTEIKPRWCHACQMDNDIWMVTGWAKYGIRAELVTGVTHQIVSRQHGGWLVTRCSAWHWWLGSNMWVACLSPHNNTCMQLSPQRQDRDTNLSTTCSAVTWHYMYVTCIVMTINLYITSHCLQSTHIVTCITCMRIYTFGVRMI